MSGSVELARVLSAIELELSALNRRVAGIEEQIDIITATKDWYSTSDVANLLGVTVHTVRERWCNQARIECEKDPVSGQWRIPHHEYDRLKRGGKPLSNRAIPLLD